MIDKEILEQYPNIETEWFEWLKRNNRATYGLKDVCVMGDNEIKLEQQMAWEYTAKADDWATFCKEKEIKDSQVLLLAIY